MQRLGVDADTGSTLQSAPDSPVLANCRTFHLEHILSLNGAAQAGGDAVSPQEPFEKCHLWVHLHHTLFRSQRRELA